MRRHLAPKRLRVEALEPRLVLSLIFTYDPDLAGADHSAPDDGQYLAADDDGQYLAADDDGQYLVADEARGGGGNGGGVTAPPIRLDLVALHEFGHALGLEHSTDPTSIMYAYYNANYDTSSFASDSAAATLQALYANVSTSPWKDSLDPHPGNGSVDVTYSFVPDGTAMDKGSSTTFTTFDTIFGAGQWQAVFAAELNRWASVSNGKLNFEFHAVDTGLKFNFNGASQNDTRAGDIRIAAHQFDGAGKVLAHTYFPPPNGSTAAGDAHFDHSENWVLTASSSSFVLAPLGATGSARGALTLAPSTQPVTDGLLFELGSTHDKTLEHTSTSIVAQTRLAPILDRITAQPVGSSFLFGSPAPLADLPSQVDFRLSVQSDAVDYWDDALASADLCDAPWLEPLAVDLARIGLAAAR